MFLINGYSLAFRKKLKTQWYKDTKVLFALNDLHKVLKELIIKELPEAEQIEIVDGKSIEILK